MTGRDSGFARTCTLHNVRLSKSARVLYPYHPLFGRELEVFGGAGGQRDVIYVRLPNNTTRGIPAWMFDEVLCSGIRTAEQPTIDGDALLRLAHLLDSVQESLRIEEDDNNTSFQTKSTSLSTSTSASVTAGSVVGIGGAKSAHPRNQAGDMRAVASQTTGDRRPSETIPSRRQR